MLLHLRSLPQPFPHCLSMMPFHLDYIKSFLFFFPHKVAIRNCYPFLVTFSPTFPFICQLSHAVLYMYINFLGKIAAGLGSAAESAAGQLRIYFGKISVQKSLFMLMSTGLHVGTEFFFRLLFWYHHETIWVTMWRFCLLAR